MSNSIQIDSLSLNSYNQICDYLYDELKTIIQSNRAIIFLCIGNDRSTGDSLGPLIGHKLKSIKRTNIYIYGSLDSPILSKNISSILNKINQNFTNPYVIAINASLGNYQSVGKVHIDKKPLSIRIFPNEDTLNIGNMSITGFVNISSNIDFVILQNTKLGTVMGLADCISNGIYHFILKIFQDNSLGMDSI